MVQQANAARCRPQLRYYEIVLVAVGACGRRLIETHPPGILAEPRLPAAAPPLLRMVGQVGRLPC